ncbi:hypothetical protein Poly24_32440 [Rosistilla carotiformis]|uniref:Rhamnan synthesis protein F n=2 Tax=Rosistilla carotiformis TaxID=2528017 RepID=A0A518JVH5_9BACT|nr:hypothetical protein Poly24_32440 [Rosistilla carotiformis]
MLRKLVRRYRATHLSHTNRRALRRVVTGGKVRGRVPIFFIFTPELVHFAPFCMHEDLPGFESVIVLNAVSADDEFWLRKTLPNRPLVRLSASLRSNSQSMLAHADVLKDLCAVCPATFCIQDPDCFVTDPAFYGSVSMDPDVHFAAGPFTKSTTDHGHDIPDTFFLMLHGAAVQRIRDKFGVSADVTVELPSAAANALRTIGYKPGEYPEQFKGYFDTLQAYWLLSLAEGRSFNKLPGDGTSLYHIGGTSYLINSDLDLSHWDFWPLSVRYFNMRLLEFDCLARFRERFRYLNDIHGTAGRLLLDYPAFLKSSRYSNVDRILNAVGPVARA